MDLFCLPISTSVNRNIPKNAFDQYTNSKQKKLFIDLIDKIRWTNKLSKDTINLSGKNVQEIQLFQIALKQKESISELLSIIDKAIPYHIIFSVSFENEIFISASQKHSHPTNEDIAVIDWAFTSPWIQIDNFHYCLNLQQSLDFIFADLCNQLVGRITIASKSINELVSLEKKLNELNNSIAKLKSAITKSKQFNQKVELNLELQNKLKELSELEKGMA